MAMHTWSVGCSGNNLKKGICDVDMPTGDDDEFVFVNHVFVFNEHGEAY